MAYRFQSFRRLLRSALALTATAALAACCTRPADAGVILISLPDGSAQSAAELDVPQVWPWVSPAAAKDVENTRPIVTLAPDLSLSVPAAPAAVDRNPEISQAWSDSARNIAISLLGIDTEAWGESAALVTERAAQWGSAIRDQPYLARLFRASIEAEQVALIESIVKTNETRLEAAPAVGTAVTLPVAPATIRSSVSVEDLAILSRNLLSTAGLDTAGIMRAVSSVWDPQTSIAPIIDLFETKVESPSRESNVNKRDDADNTQSEANNAADAQAHVPLSVLTRPLIRGAADMLNSAGGSLQALAADLSKMSEAKPTESERQATRPTSQQPQLDETTAIPLDPAAQHFFGF